MEGLEEGGVCVCGCAVEANGRGSQVNGSHWSYKGVRTGAECGAA